MNPNWTTEQRSLYRQLTAIIFGNLPTTMPATSARAFANSRALVAIDDPELFPPT